MKGFRNQGRLDADSGGVGAGASGAGADGGRDEEGELMIRYLSPGVRVFDVARRTGQGCARQVESKQSANLVVAGAG